MSSDTYVMDEKLVSTLNGFVLLGLGLISSLLWITIVVPYIIIPSTIIIVLLLFLNYYVIGIARKYRQFELVTRSNLFSNINSMMHGITAIRCYKKLEFFKQRMSMDCEVNL